LFDRIRSQIRSHHDTPNPNPIFGPVHQIMHVSNGIHLLENMKLDEPAANQHLRLL